METGSLWKASFEKELEQAEIARANGNEGKARVCARRASGIAIQEYFFRAGLPYAPHSAYQNLIYLKNSPDAPPHVQEIATHLLERVTPEHELPLEADLITDARWLAQILLGEQ